MKRLLLSLSVIMTALLAPVSAWSSAKVHFTFLWDNDTLKEYWYNASTSIPQLKIYSQGDLLTQSSSWLDTWAFAYEMQGVLTLTLDDAFVGKTVSYKSDAGHMGKFTVKTDGDTIPLNFKKLIITTTESDGTVKDWEQYQIQSEDGSYYSKSTDDNGLDSLYLAPDQFYSYQWFSENQRGTFYLADNDTLYLIANSAVTPPTPTQYFTLKVKGRYGDFPYGQSYFRLYESGEEDNYDWAYSYGSQVLPGTYRVRDDIGMFSDEFTVTKDTTIWLDYHKVTFTAKTGTTPNANENVYVSTQEGNSSKATNASGEATFYLLKGDYKYSFAEKYTEFTVGNQDQKIDIRTSKVIITLQCDDPAALSTVPFRWGTANGDTYYYGNAIYPENGKLTITSMPGSYRLLVNEIGTVDVNVVAGENNKTVTLHALQFDTNISTTNRIYFNNQDDNYNSLNLNYKKKYYFAPGNYYYFANSLSDYFALTKDTTIAINYGTLTVTVKDNNGVVEGEFIEFANNSGRTDKDGKIKFQLPYGKYELSAPNSYVSDTIVLNEKEMTKDLTLPPYVNFKVMRNGRNLTDLMGFNITDTSEGKHYQLIIKNGETKARLDPTKKYMFDGYEGTSAITEGCTVSLGLLRVTTEGMGIAIPMEVWAPVSVYNVVVGATVRLTAIPVEGQHFNGWDINGKIYPDGMIDLTVPDPITIAKAKFSAEGTQTQIRENVVNTTFQFDDNYIYLPGEIKGSAKIYAIDGKLAKSIGVAGDKIGIYDLPEGSYIISLTTDKNDVQIARFFKK